MVGVAFRVVGQAFQPDRRSVRLESLTYAVRLESLTYDRSVNVWAAIPSWAAPDRPPSSSFRRPSRPAWATPVVGATSATGAGRRLPSSSSRETHRRPR